MADNNLYELIEKEWLPFLKKYYEKESYKFNCKTPDEIKYELDFSLSKKGAGEKALKKILEKAAAYTPDVKNPAYLSYLYAAPDIIGLIGEWFVSLVNTNLHAYEASPFLAVAEVELVKELAKLIGFDKKSDGIFCPGGSYSNLLAMYLARRRFAPDSTTKGIFGRKFVVFTSDQAHYSVDRAAALLGIGTDFVRKIKSDKKGRMLPQDLKLNIEEALKRNEEPFLVSATIGTTVLGAFDPLDEIKSVLSNYPKIWLHVDGAWGGAAIISEKYKKIVKGIETADSVTWDFHKASSAPLLCSALIVKNGLDLQNLFSDGSSYLLHGEGGIENFHLGSKTPQCGRKGDAFKFWFMLKIRGKDYFAKKIEKRFEITEEFIKLLKKDEAFLIYDEDPDFLNVCFWCVPKKLRKLADIEKLSKQDKENVDKLTVKIYDAMKKNGDILINYAKVKNLPSFIRFVESNDNLDFSHLPDIIYKIKSIGDALSP